MAVDIAAIREALTDSTIAPYVDFTEAVRLALAELERLRAVHPAFAVGETVAYFDRQKRRQTAEIIGIDAHWTRPGADPVIIYTVRHPTYFRRLFHTTEARFVKKENR